MRDSIKETFPNKNVYAVGKSVSRFKYYGELDKIDISTLPNSLLIVLDVPNIHRIDVENYELFKEVIKIDHHPFEDKMGDIEWVEPSASSTCQLITELIFNSKLKLTKKVAENLFLGIVSDSDRFLLNYTTSETFDLVSKLIKISNLDFTNLYKNLYERPISEIKFHGYLAQNMTVTENGLGYIKITPEILKEYGVDSATPSNMINDFNFIKEIYVWIFITYDENNKIYKANIRSRGPIINEIASRFGGGGHPLASGVRNQDEEEMDGLIVALDAACKEYKKKNKK